MTMMNSAFADVAGIAPQQIWEGVVVRAVHGEHATMALVELAPGSVVPEHRHPNEQMGVLVRGTFRFRIGDETREFGPGQTWRIPADVPHEVEAGPDGALAIELWSPPREDWKTIEPQPPRAPGWPTTPTGT